MSTLPPMRTRTQCTMPYVRLLLILLACVLFASAADMRLGIIGTDTSHVPAFSKLLNSDPAAPDHVAGAHVVAAFKGGSKDIEDSSRRVDGFAEDIRSKY